eukprot:1684883-Pyramimonas_sp.AAC.1
MLAQALGYWRQRPGAPLQQASRGLARVDEGGPRRRRRRQGRLHRAAGLEAEHAESRVGRGGTA